MHLTAICPDPNLDLKILDVHVAEQQPGTFGMVRSGHIEAIGLLQRIVIDRLKKSPPHDYPWESCQVNDGIIPNPEIIVHYFLDKHSSLKEPFIKCWALRVGIQPIEENYQSSCFWRSPELIRTSSGV
jgi:hypothetical protein